MNRGRTKYMTRFYGLLSSRYDRVMDLLYGKRDWTWRQAALDLLTPADRVLEVGAGTGRTGRLAPAVAEYVSLDITRAMLAASPEICNPAQADVHLLPFPDHAFDVVVATLLMSTQINHSRAVAEMARVICSDGRVILIDKFSGSTRQQQWWDRLRTWLTYPLAFEFGLNIEDVARLAGLSVVSREPVPQNMGLIEKVVLQ